MLLFILLSFFLLLSGQLSVQKQKNSLVLSFIILFIISAYRGVEVGTDTINYELYFYNIINNLNDTRYLVEPGWVYLNDIVGYFQGEFRDVLVLTSAVTLTLIYFVANRFSKNPMLTIAIYYLLYFYFISFNISRQMVAVSIALLALVYLTKNKYFIFLCFVFLATFFHKSAFVLLPLVLVSQLPSSRMKIYALVFISMVVGIFGVSYLPKLAVFLGYGHYLSNYGYGNYLGPIVVLIFYNFIFISFYLMSDRKAIETKIFIAFVISFNLLARFPFGSRIYIYLSIYQLLFLPYCLHGVVVKKDKAKIVFTKAILFIYLYFNYFKSLDNGGIFPYSNVLFN